MSAVTFTTEQVREIRRRIERLYPRSSTNGGPWTCSVDAVLAVFPLPKETRYRVMLADDSCGGMYRVKDGFVEYRNDHVPPDSWDRRRVASDGDIAAFAAFLAHDRAWGRLATFVDMVQRPTEEVTPDAP